MDVYAADIGCLAGREAEALALLSPSRRERALRLRSGEARRRCVCAGLLLRRFVGEGPYAYGDRGKPYLPGGPEFSLTHSGRVALLAISELPVGLDAEGPRPVGDRLAQRICTPAELLWLQNGDADRFFFLWTRKEAVMKACGLGFSLPPRSFSVLPGETVALKSGAYQLETQKYGETAVSVAVCGGEAAFALVPVGPDTLFT